MHNNLQAKICWAGLQLHRLGCAERHGGAGGSEVRSSLAEMVKHASKYKGRIKEEKESKKRKE